MHTSKRKLTTSCRVGGPVPWPHHFPDIRARGLSRAPAPSRSLDLGPTRGATACSTFLPPRTCASQARLRLHMSCLPPPGCIWCERRRPPHARPPLRTPPLEQHRPPPRWQASAAYPPSRRRPPPSPGSRPPLLITPLGGGLLHLLVGHGILEEHAEGARLVRVSK